MTSRSRRALISLITDRARYAPGRMLETLADAARAGVDLIQIREHDLEDRALFALVRAAVAAVAGTPARVIVNERCDVALAAGAAGVHLRGDSVAASDVRRITPAAFVVGRSVHSVAEALAVAAGGKCDYLTFGTVFPSRSKPPGHPVAGLDDLAGVCRAVTLPVLAVGGVTESRAPAIAAAGAAGLAAIGLFAEAPDLVTLVARLRQPFDTSSSVV